MRLFIPKYNFKVLEEQLLSTIEVLDRNYITYHLEGGTLLGIVRDDCLLPWDHDTDISIMAEDIDKLFQCLPEIKKKWRVTIKKFKEVHDFSTSTPYRILKVKDRHLHFLAGANTLDIFVKHTKDSQTFWQAVGNIMSVDSKHYDGYDTISWKGKELKAPRFHKEYLTKKYGDWSIPVKDWHCSMEKTVVKKNET